MENPNREEHEPQITHIENGVWIQYMNDRIERTGLRGFYALPAQLARDQALEQELYYIDMEHNVYKRVLVERMPEYEREEIPWDEALQIDDYGLVGKDAKLKLVLENHRTEGDVPKYRTVLDFHRIVKRQGDWDQS